MYEKALAVTLDPKKIILKAWKKAGLGSFQARLAYDVIERPHYAYCVYHAALEAQRLGYDSISVAEFGVAGGQGLIALENIVDEVEKIVPVKIEIYGFDTGEGLPDPVDYRDLPYIWKSGFYRMDQDALRKRLRRAQLVLGDVKTSVPEFLERGAHAPIGAGMFDLDFWSSTAHAMRIFESDQEKSLPRVFCYFDDVISADGGGILCDDVGQLLAIRDYNEKHSNKKVKKIAGLGSTRSVRSVWNEQIYVHHNFEHQKYTSYIHNNQDRQLSI